MKIKDLKRIIREELSSIQELGFDYPGKVKSQDLDQESDDYRRGYTDGLRDGYDRGFKDGQVGDLDENAPAKEKETTTAPPKTKPGNPGLTPTPGQTPKETPAKAVGKNNVKEDKAAILVKGIMNKYKKLKK